MSHPPNAHARLVDQLGRLIAGREIGEGGTLPREDELCERFSVSRTVVREATKTLQALGLVVTRPRIGSRIQPVACWRLLDPQVMGWMTEGELTSGLVRDLLDLRAMIEPAAAALAAERATPIQQDAIAAELANMNAATSRAGHRQADFAFHEAILEAAGNALLLQLRPVLQTLLKGSFRLSMHDLKRVRASLPVHEQVADAIRRRDAREARRAMVALLQVARRDIELHLESRQPRPARRFKAPGEH